MCTVSTLSSGTQSNMAGGGASLHAEIEQKDARIEELEAQVEWLSGQPPPNKQRRKERESALCEPSNMTWEKLIEKGVVACDFYKLSYLRKK